jgi:hypothetical protein
VSQSEKGDGETDLDVRGSGQSLKTSSDNFGTEQSIQLSRSVGVLLRPAGDEAVKR